MLGRAKKVMRGCKKNTTIVRGAGKRRQIEETQIKQIKALEEADHLGLRQKSKLLGSA